MSTATISKQSIPPAQLPPQLALARMISGYAVSQLFYVAVRLGIADLLKDGPLGIDELASRTTTLPAALHRVMRGLAAVGLIKENESRRFELTALGEYLRTDIPDSLAAVALLGGDSYLPWGHLLHAIETGETAFEHVFGMNRYRYLEENPDAAVRFNAAMASFASQLTAAVVSAYDFSQFENAVDVGGGKGGLLLAILRANPNLRGTLFDTSWVVDAFEEKLEESGIGERCNLIAGDFFESVPEGGDLYLLSHVTHNWADDDCIRILENCRKALRPEGRLLLIEMIMPAELSPSFATYPLVMTDLQMLVMTGGRERTAAEFGALLNKAGFHLERIVPTRALESIIECTRQL